MDVTDEGEPAPEQTGLKIRAAGAILLVVGGVSLFTALMMSGNDGEPIRGQLPSAGGMLGAYEFEADTVLEIEVKQSLKQEGWAFVSGELLNADEEYLFGFGEELWWETGRDSEGYSWNEARRSFDLKITVPEAGTFFFDFAVESGLKSSGRAPPGAPSAVAPESYLSGMDVVITKKAGSNLPHMVGGMFMLLFGVVVFAIGNARAQREALVAALGH